jgi:hypothetical protein
MKMHRFVATMLVLTTAFSATPASVFAQQSTTLAGTAKDEAKKPFSDYTVRARDVRAGTIAASVSLDPQGAFSLVGLSTQNYLVELLNKDGKVVCTEGPFDLEKQAIKSDVIIDCGGIPAAWWLIGAAAAAGITAGIIAAGPASPSR